jgi:hypothetical protein
VKFSFSYVHDLPYRMLPFSLAPRIIRSSYNNNKFSYIQISESTINPDDDSEKKATNAADNNNDRVVLGVHAGDSLYKEVRNQHVERFGTFLQNQALALKESHANFTNKGTQKDLQQIHQFVKQIPVSRV